VLRPSSCTSHKLHFHSLHIAIQVFICLSSKTENPEKFESGIKQNLHKLRVNWSNQSQPQAGFEVLSNRPLKVSEDSVVVNVEQ